MGGSIILEKEMVFLVGFEGFQRGFLSERKGKDIPCRGAEDGNGSGAESGKSGTRTLEAGRVVRSRAESTGGCVKLKTVTEIRRSSARDSFIAESVDLVLIFLWDWKPVERLKQIRGVMWSVLRFFRMRQAAKF